MNLLLMLLAVSLLLLPLVISIRRSTELFRLRVRGGRAEFIRGRIPQGLLDDFNDVVSSPPLEHVEIWAVPGAGKAELMTKGEVHRDQLQRLRNTLGTYTLQRIKAGGRRR